MKGIVFVAFRLFNILLKEGLVSFQCLDPLEPQPDGSREPLGMACGQSPLLHIPMKRMAPWESCKPAIGG